MIETLVDEPRAGSAVAPNLLGQLFTPMDQSIDDVFLEFGLQKLGGPSSGLGWSNYSLAQRCMYAWKLRYVDDASPEFFVESPALAVGSLIHVLLALYYMNMMGLYLKLPPDRMIDGVRKQANPELVDEAWRVFQVYRIYYKADVGALRPLAVEHDLKDPRTGRSCRYDLIAYFEKELPGRLPGTYIFEHKSASRFDMDTIDGWANDGEVIGEAMLWEELGLDRRFGPLRGVVVNILGKQKEPQFHRTTIAPNTLLSASHKNDLKRWEGLLQLAKSSDNWPRSRANCINRFGRCPWWERCATGER